MHFFNKFPEIAKEGYPFIIISIVINIILFMMSGVAGVVFLFVTIWCVCFFRDPKRVTPNIKGAVISPADGLVQSISVVNVPDEVEALESEEMVRISIFMSVFNVHMNRSPIKGQITDIHYKAGKFFNASLDKASEHNERQSFIIKSDHNKDIKIVMVQIAGLIARRIVKFVKNDTSVKAGEKIGLIRFGSRVDIFVPKHIKLSVIEGQTVIGGETVLANILQTKSSDSDYLTGEIFNRASSDTKHEA